VVYPSTVSRPRQGDEHPDYAVLVEYGPFTYPTPGENVFYHTTTIRFTNGHYAGQSASAGTSSFKLEDFVGAKFHCPHALADGNQRTRIREKTLEFSATVLSALSPNLGDKCLPST